jgi:RNA polymerase sigma factor (TIGR02999 family)
MLGVSPLTPEDPASLTQLLGEWRNGDQQAGDRLFTAAYQELRRLAAWHLQQERPGHTLQATALVNEVYLKLFAGQPVAWQNRAHFFAVAAQQMRRLLIDYARARLAQKREGERLRVSITDIAALADHPDATWEEDVEALNEALDRLAALDSRSARVIELRFFAGLTEKEAAEVAGISVATLKRDWDFGRAWLLKELKK